MDRARRDVELTAICDLDAERAASAAKRFGAKHAVTSLSELSALGVQIALGTDWLPSGSMNMLRELACAELLNDDYLDGHFSDKELWAMATTNGAFAIGGQEGVGMLKEGYVADIAVFAKQGEQDHGAVVRGHESTVALVLRGATTSDAGITPLYGDADLLASTALGAGGCEALDVCGEAKTGSGKTLAFGLPIVQTIAKAHPKRPAALILVPTRELARQVIGAIERG